jgi:hypothetical protein
MKGIMIKASEKAGLLNQNTDILIFLLLSRKQHHFIA